MSANLAILERLRSACRLTSGTLLRIRSVSSDVQCVRQSVPFGGWSGETKTEPLRLFGEIAHQDALRPEPFEQRRRARAFREPEQPRAADDLQPCRGEQMIEPFRIPGKPRRSCGGPCPVRQRASSHRNRRTGNGPRPERRAQAGRKRLTCECEPQPSAGQAVGLAEGPDTRSAGCGSSGATLCPSSKSVNASSTSSRPPCAASWSASASSASGGTRRPSGLFGLQSTAQPASHNSSKLLTSLTTDACAPRRQRAPHKSARARRPRAAEVRGAVG